MCVEVALDMHSALDNFQVQSISLPGSGMYLCSWEISPELLARVSVCVCAYMSNPTINVTTVSNGPITRLELVSNNTQLHTKNIKTQPTNGINFVIIDVDELVRALVNSTLRRREEIIQESTKYLHRVSVTHACS